MGVLFNVIAPVFIIIGFGYLAAWRTFFTGDMADAVMKFAQTIAVPCLLFTAISRVDFSADFDFRLLGSFYAGAFSGFAFAFFGARVLFKRPLTDSIAIGFCGLFSNSLLLGLPITERAYGADALTGNYTIISIHSPLLYAFGITMMEMARSRGQDMSKRALAKQVIRSIFSNALVIGIALGFVVNLGNIPLPSPLWAAIEMLNRTAIPASLFALGGILVRYRPEGDLRAIFWVCMASLIIHPVVTYGLARHVFDLETAALRSAVVTAAMAPGMNTYLFANMYGVAKRVAASGVLIGTALSILSIWAWLNILP